MKERPELKKLPEFGTHYVLYERIADDLVSDEKLVIFFSHSKKRPLLASYALPVRTYFVVDPRMAYYVSEAPKLAARLALLIRENDKIRSVCFCGASKGAYGSLLHGLAIARERPDISVSAFAFSPQTRVWPPNEDLAFPSYKALVKSCQSNPRLLDQMKQFGDLRNRVKPLPNFRGHIFYPEHLSRDRDEAMRLGSFESIELHSVPIDQHNTIFPFVVDLEDKDQMRSMLSSLLREKDDDMLSEMEMGRLDAMADKYNSLVKYNMPRLRDLILNALGDDEDASERRENASEDGRSTEGARSARRGAAHAKRD